MAKGDHIKVDRGFYWHHGIDLGDGTCVHFTGEPGKKSDACIKTTSIHEFLNGGRLEIVQYSQCEPLEDVVRTALSHVGDALYDLFDNNCEHFARYCKTGEKKSEQVKDAVSSVTGSSMAAAGTYASIAAVTTAGSVAGLSGAGVMSGLASIGVGGAVGGVVSLAVAPALAMNLAVHKVLEDDPALSYDERDARSAGRFATTVGTVAGTVGTVTAISSTGVAGLSAAGITSGLAGIGELVGGGMVAGTAISIAAPAVIATVAGLFVYNFWKWLFR